MVAVKRLYWVGSSKKDIALMPDEVQDIFGYALYLAQIGKKHEDAKPLKGFGSAGVLEVVEDWHGDTYRAVYTVRFTAAVFVSPDGRLPGVRNRSVPFFRPKVI